MRAGTRAWEIGLRAWVRIRAGAPRCGAFAVAPFALALFGSALFGLAMLVPAGASQAQAPSETANFSVSVTVDNSFTLGSRGLSFGTIAVTASTTDSSSITINGNDGATTVSNGTYSRIIVVEPGTPGDADVTGAPPNTLMTVSITSNPTTVVHETDGAAATFSAVMNAYGAGYNFTTDAAGAMTFVVGGTLTTSTAGGTYTDGVYTGSYTVSVTY